MTLNLLQPGGYNSSTCGYCSTNGVRNPGSRSYGFMSSQMTPQFYLDLMNRGWRRSGDYFYHPDMERTCCPQFTIRLDVARFKVARQQRSSVNRWNRFLRGEGEGNGTANGEGKGSGKKDKGKPFDLMAELYQYRQGGQKHKFELELTPAIATDETFALYERYQVAVHNDKPGSVRRSGFERFLCDSPLSDETISYTKGANTAHLPEHYGSYHLLYRVDSKLIGISVIDILPSCVSSVYFIWDPDWAWASLGKLSALYELGLVREMAAAGAPMEWLYMGFWIANCNKMRYKGEYTPSFLLDPGTNEFHPLTTVLDEYLQCSRGYTPFVKIEGMDPKTVKAKYDKWKVGRGGGRADMDIDRDVARQGSKAGLEDTEEIELDGGEDSEDDYEDDDDDDDEFPSPPPPGFASPDGVDLGEMIVAAEIGPLQRLTLLPFSVFQQMLTATGRRMAKEMVAAVGVDLMGTAKGYEGKGLMSFD